MAREMAEQPAVVERLVRRREQVAVEVKRLLPPWPWTVMVMARGSSDNAAIYGRYLIELVSGRPVALAAPSLMSLYESRHQLDGVLAIGISQSGETPEIAAALATARRAGARALAITNVPGSPLAAAADGVLLLDAGEERAVPATKTVLAQMTMLALVAESTAPPPWEPIAWQQLLAGLRAVLAEAAITDALSALMQAAAKIVVVGRGLMYPAALEIALKLRETTGLPVEALSAGDLWHGLIAGIDTETTVLVCRGSGRVGQVTDEAVQRLERQVRRVVVVGEHPAAQVRLWPALPEALEPILAVVRGQQLARALALRLGADPDYPPQLHKVTLAI